MSKQAIRSAERAGKKQHKGKAVMLPTPNENLSIQAKEGIRRATLKAREMNGTILAETAGALSSPGISRHVVFTHADVSSYSIDPSNLDRIVSTNAKGKATVGRFVNGHFRPLPSK